jgi:DNA repair exonuclease SbcCD ATPase subunit
MKQVFTLILIAVFALNACGPSLESENENWKRNVDAAAGLKAEYPVYKPLIEMKVGEATKLWDEAASISNEDQKLKKMVEANDILEKGCIGNLMNMKSKISDLKSKKESLMALKTPNYQLEQRAQNAFETVEDAIKKADKVIYMVPDDFNVDEASVKIDKAWNAINDAYKEVEIIIENINKENQAITTDKEKKEQEIKDDKLKAEEAAKDIKCPYCGTMNAADYKKCKSCGAPRE